MKLTNPNEDRAIIASIDGTHYEIPAGGTLETDDYIVGSTLVEYGAKAVKVELEAARELWADRNRTANSRTASASASEGKIIGRQQATVDVATGTMEPGELRGSALASAVAEANASGAEIKSTLSADEKREALALWQAQRGASSPPGQTLAEQFQTDEHGDLILVDGQPVPLAGAGEADAANVEVPDFEVAEEIVAWIAEGDDVAVRRLRADAFLAKLEEENAAAEDDDKLSDEDVATLRELVAGAVGDGVES